MAGYHVYYDNDIGGGSEGPFATIGDARFEQARIMLERDENGARLWRYSEIVTPDGRRGFSVQIHNPYDSWE
jgi:hypothetical protein